MASRRLSLILLALAVSLGAAYAMTELGPRRYIATAAVLQPDSVLRFEHVSTDPAEAHRRAAADVAAHPGRLLDSPRVLPVRGAEPLTYALAAALGLVLGLALVVQRERARRAVRHERELVGALGAPLLAARPARDAALRELCRQLLEHWLTGGRTLLPVVSACRGEGRTRIAARLAAEFGAMGVRTLLVDADLRSPGQHRAFRLGRRRGLAEFLGGRPADPAVCGEHLAVLTAGAASAEPLELLSRRELQEFLAAAGKRFRVVLVDTPALERGPDLEIFAALAGGALVVAQRSRVDQAALGRLRQCLGRVRARVVATVLDPA